MAIQTFIKIFFNNFLSLEEQFLQPDSLTLSV